MIHRGLARRYARALFRAALKQDIAGQLQEDINSYLELDQKDSSLMAFLLSPQMLTSDKVALVHKALDGKVQKLFVDMLLLLVDKKRFDHIIAIFEAYTALYEEHCGILEAKVVSALPLDANQEEALRTKLERETDKEIRLTKVVNPDIIGGLVVYLGDKVIDGSVKFQLESHRKALKLAKVY
jgi:F-type H+-transporting ATPase subunit delta